MTCSCMEVMKVWAPHTLLLRHHDGRPEAASQQAGKRVSLSSPLSSAQGCNQPQILFVLCICWSGYCLKVIVLIDYFFPGFLTRETRLWGDLFGLYLLVFPRVLLLPFPAWLHKVNAALKKLSTMPFLGGRDLLLMCLFLSTSQSLFMSLFYKMFTGFSCN